MAGLFLHAAGNVDAGSLPSATNGSSVTPKLSPNAPEPRDGSSNTYAFPKTSRILKSRDFRKVYDEGTRMTSPSFAAFLFKSTEKSAEPPHVGGPFFGFTTPRALGKAVVRNRVRRRMREAVRLEQHLFAPGWSIVFNPRRTLADVPFEALRKEVARVAARCKP
jgi:ribonuclease P protein component